MGVWRGANNPTQYIILLVTKVEQRKKLDRLNDERRKKTRDTEITLATWSKSSLKNSKEREEGEEPEKDGKRK